MISDDAFTYLSAAEELTELFKSQALQESLSKQARCKLAVHTETSTVARRVLGAIERPHQDYPDEGTWTSIR